MGQELADQALRFRLLGREPDVVLFEQADQRVVVCLGADRVVLQRRALTEIDSFTLEDNPLHLAGAHLAKEFRIIGSLGRRTAHATQALHHR